MPLIDSSYGKSRVRVMRVQRDGAHHTVRELTVQVSLQGGFDRAYTHADNRGVVATDTMRNIVNIVARENIAADNETFAMALAHRFLDAYATLDAVRIATAETRWTRLQTGGAAHPHSFVLDANGHPTVRLDMQRAGGPETASLRSGIEGFTFMKTTQSGWSDFLIDQYTTLPPTDDRIAATSMNANWLWSAMPVSPMETGARILQIMLDVFATTYSHSVQDSVYRMGEAALAAVPEIVEIAIACPNKHYLPINLAAFGLAADNMVFTPTDEPHGQIECLIRR